MRKILSSFVLLPGSLLFAQAEKDSLKSKTISEVIIVAKKPNVETKVDRTVFNVANTSILAGNTTWDILRMTPLVSIDNNDVVKSEGENVTVYINDRKSVFKGKDLKEYLKSIPADNLMKIEVITNPSARYESAGQVINIVLKKRDDEGLKGSVSFTNSQNNKNNQYANANLNYHKNNFTQTIIGGYNEDNYQASNKIENQLFLDNEIRKINSDDTNNYSMPSLSSTSEWELNDKNNLGVIVELLQSNSNSNNNSTGNITKNDILFNDYSMEQYAKYKNAMLSSNVFYKYYDKTKNKIFDVNLGVNYSANNNDSNFLRNQTINPTQETTKIIDHTEMRNYYLKLDYSQPLDSLGSSIETGAKFDFNNNTVPTDYYGFAAPLLENRFQYKDNVNSVYANYSSKFFKKLEVRLGLRYEYIFLNLHQQIGEQSRKDSYGKLLPNLLLKYTFTPNFNISTSYSHNLSRPYYTEYNPFETPTSDGNYYRGNLDLVANTNHRFTMKFGVYKKYFLSLVYGFTNQDYWTDYVKDGDKLIETSANFLGKSERY